MSVFNFSLHTKYLCYDKKLCIQKYVLFNLLVNILNVLTIF